jgi:hypothetical protein
MRNYYQLQQTGHFNEQNKRFEAYLKQALFV